MPDSYRHILEQKTSDSKEDMVMIPYINFKKRQKVLILKEVKITSILYRNGFDSKRHEGTFLE